MNRTATYTWHPGTDRWTWDAAMYRLHGYTHRAVIPTRSLFLAHRHPGDREHVREVLSRAAVHGQAFACRHRLLTSARTLRHAVVIGGTARTGRIGDGDGPHVRGYVVDVSPPVYDRPDGCVGSPPDEPYAAVDPELGRAVAVLRDGMSLTREAAADLLGWLAITHEVPLLTVATDLLAAPRAAPPGSPADVASLLQGLAASARVVEPS